MAWCREATSHYLSQCWPRSLMPYGVTRPQWVNQFKMGASPGGHCLTTVLVLVKSQTRLKNRYPWMKSNVPNLQMNWCDFTKWESTSIVVPVMATRASCPFLDNIALHSNLALFPIDASISAWWSVDAKTDLMRLMGRSLLDACGSAVRFCCAMDWLLMCIHVLVVGCVIKNYSVDSCGTSDDYKCRWLCTRLQYF